MYYSTMLFHVTLFLYIFLSFVSSFPLKICSLNHKEILFVIDCHHEVRRQIDFLNQTVEYLRDYRNWTSLNVSYMTYKENELSVGRLEVLTANITENARQISKRCNGTISIDDLFLKTNVAPGTRKMSTLRLNLIFLKIDSDQIDLLHQITGKQDKVNDEENFRFFILSYKSENQIPATYFHYVESFKDLNIFNVFPKICDIKCIDTNLTFVSQNFQRSFYHVEYTNKNHKEGVEYCDKKFNSYLVSIETYKELNYLIGEILPMHISSNMSEILFFHLGLDIKPGQRMYWSSGNPFTFYHQIQQYIPLKCAYFNYTMNVNNTLTFQIKDIWKYLHQVGCDNILNGTYLVCECHQQLQTEVHFDIKPFNRPDTYGLVGYFDVSYYFYYSYDIRGRYKMQTLNCFNTTYAPYEENNYFCKETNLIDSIQTYVQSTYLKKYSERNCYSSCNHFYTIYSENKINSSIAMSESYCHKYGRHECLSSIVNVPQEMTTVSCTSYDDFSPKCLLTDYYTSCRDNSHLENCESIKCPDGFLKCPNSYCIPIRWMRHNDRLCPLGQEKTIFTRKKRICSVKISLKFKDICIHTESLKKITERVGPNSCDDMCPMNYSCVSYKNEDNLTRVLQEKIELYNVSDSLMPYVERYFYIPYLQIIEIKVPECKIQNLDQALKHWEKTQTVILDLSKNEISDSNNMQSVTSMNVLRFLNVSHNVKLSINDKFVFPNTLEVIDLSYTAVESIPENSFVNLNSLRILNLSFTRIHTFENMGLPRYFTLDILNIQGVVMIEIKADFYKGLTVQTSLWSSDFKLCCPQILGDNIPSRICYAPYDAISSCKNVVGDTLKRILIWVVGFTTIVGNSIVLIYRVVWCREKIFQTAYGLYVTGLAASDLLMGVYLMIIAAVDMIYADVYVIHDANWRKSFICHFSGFLSTLSSETSTFLIGFITLDRFISLSNPFSVYKTSTNLKWKCFILVWIIGFILAFIPAIVPEWQIYSSNGLCLALPLSTTGSYKLPGWEFSMAIFVILNFILFLFVSIGQVGIFVSVIKTRNIPLMIHCSERRNQDIQLAIKLAFVALSDFLCWFPIGIMGILSLSGQEFDKETYAWMAVFVLPVNSALNPLIYTIPAIIDRIKCKTV